MKNVYKFHDGLFYPPEVVYETMPADAINVSAEEFNKAMSRPAGWTFSVSADGLVTLVEPPPPTKEQLIQIAETERQRLLADADAVMLDWRTELMLGEISDANKAKLSAWMAYKNEIKAVDVTTDLEHINWPVPSEV